MVKRHKLLVLDDDPDFLDVYREILAGLPSGPQIQTATSGARAISLLESEPFTLLLCDLNMPKMDGLQVLAIVRRRFPELRTVVMTAMVDEQYRARAYGMGVDLFLEKPGTPEGTKLFLDCIESLLDRDVQTGFRGIQSKNLVDIIQLESLSQSSSVLKVVNGPLEGRIWFQNGDIIDAVAVDLQAGAAFRRIMGWKTGSFESLPADADHPRTIFESCHSLLLDSAQAIDEASGEALQAAADAVAGSSGAGVSRMSGMSQMAGMEFAVAIAKESTQKFEAWGAENPEQMAAWTRQVFKDFRALGDRLEVGQLQLISGVGWQRQAALVPAAQTDFCLGFQRNLPAEQIRETTKKILALWES
jgi:CheY-like chemotaxis protein